MKVPWTARRSNQSILKEIIPEYSLEGLMLKLKLQYFGHLMQRTDSLEKPLMLGKIEGRRRRGRQDEMVGWHHRLDEHEFEQALGVGDGEGSLACCSPWGCKESDTTEQLSLSIRTDWFDLLAVQGTVKSSVIPQSKALILCHSALFVVQLSHPYMTSGKTIALTIWTFDSKVISLLLNMLSRYDRLYFSKITMDNDCNHEIKRLLLL